MTTLIIVALLLVLIALGAPIALALLVAGAAGLGMVGGPNVAQGILSTAPLSAAKSYELITIPMFLLMAELIIVSGIAKQLFDSAVTWVGRTPAGLAVATSLAGAGFGAISGSSTASAATLAATTVPGMLERGYEPKIACGVVAISGTLAMLIPPSIALILYGIVADVSIGRLLIAGIIPGVLVAITVILTVLYLVWRDPARAPRGQAYGWREKVASLPGVLPMLGLFVVVTGLIYTGIATPTESSALGAIGSLVLALASGNATRANLVQAVLRAGRTTCMILFIILGAHIFGYFMALTRLSHNLADWVGGLDMAPVVVMLIILAAIILLGTIMDQAAIIILTVPITLPLVLALGYDPVWFGVMMVVTAEIGLVTPPVGLNSFVVARYTGRPLEEVFSGIWPHVVAHILLVLLMLALPQIILWLPSTM